MTEPWLCDEDKAAICLSLPSSTVILLVFALFSVYECLPCVHVCTPCICLVPVAARIGHWLPGTGLTDGCEPPSGCWIEPVCSARAKCPQLQSHPSSPSTKIFPITDLLILFSFRTKLREVCMYSHPRRPYPEHQRVISQRRNTKVF